MTDGAFPTGLALMKPQQTIEPAEFEHLWRRGDLIPTRKRDGNRLHVVTAKALTRVYSRNGTVDLTDRLGHIVAHYAKAPSGLIIDGEGHTLEEGTERYQAAMNTSPEEVMFSPFDLLRTDLSNAGDRYRDRANLLDQIEQVLGHGDCWGGGVFFHLPEAATYQDVLDRIARARCEGVVMWDASAPHAVNTNGNTKRGRSWKIKLRHTEDMLATKANACADPSLGCGSLQISRREGDGRLVPVGKVGSFELAFDRRAARSYPCVVEVSHYGLDDNGNLSFGKIVRARPDLHADFGLDLAKAA